jgi:PAS domain S-box-containing protein
MPRGLRKNVSRLDPVDTEGEAPFRTIFENAAVGISRVARDGRFLDVNQRLCQIVGYTREELLARTFGEITHPEDRETDLKAMQEMLAGKLSHYLREKRYYRKDGSVVWCNLSVALLRKPDGSADYFISVVEDISARKEAEQKLRDSEERLRLATEAAGLGVFEWNVQTDSTVWENQRMYEIFGHTPSDGTLGKVKLIENYVCPEDAAGLERALSEGMTSGRSFRTIYRIRRKDGKVRWLGLAGSFEHAREGGPLRMLGVLADITERQRTEEELRVSEERFRILADTAPVLIWMSGRDKLCTFFNKPWLDFTGRTLEQELGDGWTQGVHPKDYDRCLTIYAQSFDAREPFKMEYRLRRHDGEYRWILDHGVPRFSHSHKFLGYIGSCLDITERKEAEAERDTLAREQVARAAAEAANRSKDEFLTLVSHELRAPLTAILGYIKLLRSGLTGTESVDKATAVIERSAQTQLRIIEDLLDSARIVTGKLRIEPSPVDIVPVLDAALDTVRTAAEAKGIGMIADFSHLPQWVLGDSTRLQQIVWNLLVNAVKFTPEHGQIELKMQTDDDHIEIRIRDNGKGISADFLPFVFDRFSQADSSTQRQRGLGLGLSLVKYLVQLHGGTITASSRGLGHGATFTVLLPLLRRNSGN